MEQNPDYTGEILLPLKHCYEELNQLDNFELFLIRAGQIINNDEVELALVKLIEEKMANLLLKLSFISNSRKAKYFNFPSFYAVSN